VLARPWRRAGTGPRRGALAALVLAGAAFLVTGLVAPWSLLTPWSPALGSNMARPMPLGQQGPFAELVGVNVRYDSAMFTVAGHRFGARATGRVYFAHVLALPILTALGAAFVLRRRP
jgi:quinol-cytochrome oxidoreductase complex cytochrome b subunit